MFQKKDSRPFLIAGPCSAETEEQVMATAHDLASLGLDIDLFRAGVWKPRTRPGAFEGNGAVALPWLRRVKQETGLRTTIEVANGKTDRGFGRIERRTKRGEINRQTQIERADRIYSCGCEEIFIDVDTSIAIVVNKTESNGSRGR